MILPTLPGNNDGTAVGNTRYRMTFTDEYHINKAGVDWTLRLYKSKGGAYGPQFRAVLWCHGPGVKVQGPWIGRKTTGCGYCKPTAAIDSVMGAAGYLDHREGSGAGGIHTSLAVDMYSIHHAHG